MPHINSKYGQKLENYDLLSFTNLNEIYKHSRDLLIDLQCRVKRWEYCQKISDVFIERAASFNLYIRLGIITVLLE